MKSSPTLHVRIVWSIRMCLCFFIFLLSLVLRMRVPLCRYILRYVVWYIDVSVYFELRLVCLCTLQSFFHWIARRAYSIDLCFSFSLSLHLAINVCMCDYIDISYVNSSGRYTTATTKRAAITAAAAKRSSETHRVYRCCEYPRHSVFCVDITCRSVFSTSRYFVYFCSIKKFSFFRFGFKQTFLSCKVRFARRKVSFPVRFSFKEGMKWIFNNFIIQRGIT